MGIDLDELWGQAKNAVESAWTDVEKVGVPALQASLEQWGIDTLSQMNRQTEATLNTNLKEVLNRPPGDGLGKYLNDALKTPIVENYGGVVIAVAVGVGVLFVVAFGRKAA